MAYTQADLDKLDAAILKGGAVDSIQFGDQSVRFKSVDDMLKLRAVIAGQVSPSTRQGYRLAATRKGV